MLQRLAMILVLAAVTVTPAQAEQSKEELARKYLELSKTREIFDRTIEAQAQQLSARRDNVDAGQVRERLRQAMGWQALKEPTVKLVSETFTKKELKDINAFYQTESGQALARKSPELSSKLSQLIARNLQQALRSR